MEKFFRQPGKDPFINTPNDTTPALFGHINAIVENMGSSNGATGLRSKTVIHDFSKNPLSNGESVVINNDFFILKDSIITAFYYHTKTPMSGDDGAKLAIGITTVGVDDILSATDINSISSSVSLSGFTPLATNNDDRGVLLTATGGDITSGVISIMILYWPFNIS